MDADVIVLGAGFAGLSAADALLAGGRSVLLLEARERVGGRTRTDWLDDELWLDLGGQWLGPGQDCMYQLAARFNRHVWPMHVAGRNILHAKGRRRSYSGLIPLRLAPWELANLGWAFFRLEQLARRVPLEAPWQAAGARKLDQQTLGDWLRRNLPSRLAGDLVRVALESVFAADPDDISLLHALFYLHSGGGLQRLTSSRGGAQQDRVEGGLQGLAEALAADVAGRGAQLRLAEPVRAVAQDGNGVSVRTDGGSYRGRELICTLPPALTLELEFQPGLPELRRQWCRGLLPGQVIKCFAIYPRPFWREQGLSGSAIGDCGPVHVAFDATPPHSQRGILMGFIEGRAAEALAEADELERQALVLNAFKRFFGAQAAQPLRYLDKVWAAEAWSRGCYAGVARPGMLTSVGHAGRQPHGRVHWAGTETAISWNGYVEGAVRSGRRAAQEILQQAAPALAALEPRQRTGDQLCAEVN